MKQAVKFLLGVACAWSALGAPATAQVTGQTLMELERDYLMKTWPGDFDNQEQVSFDATAAVDKSQSQPRFHTLVHPVTLPSLGEHVLYVEERRGDDIDQINLQRIYVLSPDESEKAVRVKTYELLNAADVAVDGRDLTDLSNISSDALRYLEGCDLLLRRDGDGLAGMMQRGECAIDDSKFRHRAVRVSKDDFSFTEAITDAKGDVLSAIADGRYRTLERARWFACMIDVPKKDPARSNHTQHYMKIHDQGGAFPFVHPDGRDMTLIMRNTWSYGMHRYSFFIGVMEGDARGRTLVYSWGMPGQDRIGVNPGWVRIQCDLDTPENVRLQHGLRSDS